MLCPFAQIHHCPRKPLFGHLSLEHALLNSPCEEPVDSVIAILKTNKITDSNLSNMINCNPLKRSNANQSALRTCLALCFQTCREETIDVHRLFLSISPYSSHGLSTTGKE